MRNKKTFFAHMHKGSKHGKGYGFSNEQYKKHGIACERGRKYCRDYWLETQDYEKDWDWFMEKFPNMPGWNKDWKNDIIKARKLETI